VRRQMWVRCQVGIQVEQAGSKFKTLEECPYGYPAGLEPGDLMDLCVACPKAEPQILANIRAAIKRPVPKKAMIKCPVPRKR
jgi:hypothetical protein